MFSLVARHSHVFLDLHFVTAVSSGLLLLCWQPRPLAGRRPARVGGRQAYGTRRVNKVLTNYSEQHEPRSGVSVISIHVLFFRNLSL